MLVAGLNGSGQNGIDEIYICNLLLKVYDKN